MNNHEKLKAAFAKRNANISDKQIDDTLKNIENFHQRNPLFPSVETMIKTRQLETDKKAHNENYQENLLKLTMAELHKCVDCGAIVKDSNGKHVATNKYRPSGVRQVDEKLATMVRGINVKTERM